MPSECVWMIARAMKLSLLLGIYKWSSVNVSTMEAEPPVRVTEGLRMQCANAPGGNKLSPYHESSHLPYLYNVRRVVRGYRFGSENKPRSRRTFDSQRKWASNTHVSAANHVRSESEPTTGLPEDLCHAAAEPRSQKLDLTVAEKYPQRFILSERALREPNRRVSGAKYVSSDYASCEMITVHPNKSLITPPLIPSQMQDSFIKLQRETEQLSFDLRRSLEKRGVKPRSPMKDSGRHTWSAAKGETRAVISSPY
ncbi:hypothetical protein PROFUN_11495 [Planoprotostelium fungivorum]|uniref:Uncharacterized protein n=1 Tax=Planoprotostelium fungivorum TaxID=1890364 RepID=A0A2P6N9X8_9EUKA|nr:hypothetical protein PROFUN_11495 [Planoprotostelium fungivorum]